MTILQALVLGIVQGATEFIPISSSAHLVLVPWLLGWAFNSRAEEVAFDVLLHWGTLLAVVLYFWRDLVVLIGAAVRGLVRGRPLETPEARLAWLIVLATIPAAILGAAFKDFFESVFSAPATVAALLLVTGLILAISERLTQHRASARLVRPWHSLTWLDALAVGVAQAVSILPGISRSGATIAAGLGRGLEREAAARFSFLLSIPIIFGAGLVSFRDLAKTGRMELPVAVLIAGFVGAAIIGYISIAALLAYLRRQSLYIFAVYCWAVGAFCLVIALLGLR